MERLKEENWMNSQGLVDTFRTINPRDQEFTRVHYVKKQKIQEEEIIQDQVAEPSTSAESKEAESELVPLARRLDRILVGPGLAPQVHKAKLKDFLVSDHSASVVTMTLKLRNFTIEDSVYKPVVMYPSLLTQDWKTEVHQLVQLATTDTPEEQVKKFKEAMTVATLGQKGDQKKENKANSFIEEIKRLHSLHSSFLLTKDKPLEKSLWWAKNRTNLQFMGCQKFQDAGNFFKEHLQQTKRRKWIHEFHSSVERDIRKVIDQAQPVFKKSRKLTKMLHGQGYKSQQDQNLDVAEVEGFFRQLLQQAITISEADQQLLEDALSRFPPMPEPPGQLEEFSTQEIKEGLWKMAEEKQQMCQGLPPPRYLEGWLGLPTVRCFLETCTKGGGVCIVRCWCWLPLREFCSGPCCTVHGGFLGGGEFPS